MGPTWHMLYTFRTSMQQWQRLCSKYPFMRTAFVERFTEASPAAPAVDKSTVY